MCGGGGGGGNNLVYLLLLSQRLIDGISNVAFDRKNNSRNKFHS